MNTTYDKILAIISLTLFAAFCFIIALWVQEWDLKLVLILGVGMASYDFWIDAFRSKASAPATKDIDPSTQHDGI
ncbi:MAG: hypothetical protein AAFV45_10535 [Pseudomonadota bacterium]